MSTRLDGKIEEYMGLYECSYDEAIEMMKSDLEEAKEDTELRELLTKSN